jgi:hypothetical protein
MNARDAGVVDRENGATGSTPATATFGLRSTSKIRDRHLDRLAMVYVRQSSPQQVLENRESRERQYALAQFAQQLGWTPERVVIVDEDQGQSGKSADNRSGFQRLMTEVSLNHVGIVLGLELSRLSRSRSMCWSTVSTSRGGRRRGRRKSGSGVARPQSERVEGQDDHKPGKVPRSWQGHMPLKGGTVAGAGGWEERPLTTSPSPPSSPGAWGPSARTSVRP